MLGWFKKKVLRREPVAARMVHWRPARRGIHGRYDAAQTTSDNRRHWGAADGLDADAANSPGVRRILRTRARYEVSNNSWARGIQSTIANDAVGTGPTLHMQLRAEDLGTPAAAGELAKRVKALNSRIEGEFAAWASEIKLAEKLRVLRAARLDSGEPFAVMFLNPRLRHAVKLDLRVIEPDQVSDPTAISVTDPDWVDGIHFDELGNPLTYRILKQHPGASGFLGASTEYDDVPADYVFHYFRPDRPGQRRGIPELTPALQQFAELRRYSEAVIAAAETAADFAAVIYSETPADADDEEGNVDPKPMDLVEIEKRTGLVLPREWKAQQFRAEQPATTYDAFVSKKLAEISRCLNVPLTIAALDSSASNLSARYLDSQIYARGIDIDRSDLGVLLDRLLAAWLLLARNAAELADIGIPVLQAYAHTWGWPLVNEHADPSKAANAQVARLSAGLTSHAAEYARSGVDWEVAFENAARALGVSLEDYQALVKAKLFSGPAAPLSEDEDEDKAPAKTPATRTKREAA